MVVEVKPPDRLQVDHHAFVDQPDHREGAGEPFLGGGHGAFAEPRIAQAGKAAPRRQRVGPCRPPQADAIGPVQERHRRTRMKWLYGEANAMLSPVAAACNPASGRPATRSGAADAGVASSNSSSSAG